MPPFTSHPLRRHPIHERLRKHPSLFGIPFVLIVVGASFGLSSFTQTKYELHDKKIQNVTKEQELGLDKNRRKFDIREEYYRLNAAQDDDGWENKRIPRPAGLPEWGVPPTEPPPKSDSSQSS